MHEYDPETQRHEKFLIAETQDLDEEYVYAKERRLVDEGEIRTCKRPSMPDLCRLYQKARRDATARTHSNQTRSAVAILTTEVPPEAREAWYERQLRAGVQAVVCHPKLVQTGLDLIESPRSCFIKPDIRYSFFAKRAVEAGA